MTTFRIMFTEDGDQAIYITRNTWEAAVQLANSLLQQKGIVTWIKECDDGNVILSDPPIYDPIPEFLKEDLI